MNPVSARDRPRVEHVYTPSGTAASHAVLAVMCQIRGAGMIGSVAWASMERPPDDPGRDEAVRCGRNPDRDRYEISRDGQVVAILSYEDTTGEDGRTIRDLRSTVVDPESTRQGVGSALVRCALDDVRDSGLRIRATCWFVAGWVQRHPEYADLLTPTPEKP